MISAAMLAKNEEHCIERCLESIKNIVDEIILVDTGSTDRTVEIASKYTDKIYHEPWRDDFGWHRNHSFGLCTKPWILGIDPDEEFIFENKMSRETLCRYLLEHTKGIDAVGMEIIDWRASRQSIAARFDGLRFFRNGCVTWHRRVHNQPDVKGESALLRDAHILHYGYDLTEEKRKAKAQRTIGLLELTLKEHPDDYESMFYMAQAYGAFLDDKDNALKWSRRYIEQRDKAGLKFNTSVYHLAAAICSIKNLEEECCEYIERGLSEDPWDIDLLMDKMQYAIRQNNRSILAMAAQKFIICYDNFDKYRFKHPGKFFFNYNLISYSSALFYASTNMIENGAIIYRKLKEISKDLPKIVTKEIDEKLVDIFNRINFSDRLNSQAPAQTPAIISAFQVPQNLELPTLQ